MFKFINAFLAELKRRKVYKVTIAYVVVALLALETVGVLIPSTTLPDWVDEFLLAIAIVGLPIAIFAAWALELTPDGVRVTQPSTADEAVQPKLKPIYSFAAAVVVLALIVTGWWLMRSADNDEVAAQNLTIAVLPFETLGAEHPNSFTEGVHLGVMTRLSDVSDLHVISRTSVNYYETTQKTLPQIAEDLGVAWILRAEVQESDSVVQINARLLNAREDRQVWAQDYRRNLSASNLFEIQAELAGAIISELKSRLTPFEQSRIEIEPTEDLEAYRLVAQGRKALDLRTEASMREALELFEGAVSRDPDYALAWVGIADTTAFIYDYGFDRDPQYPARSKAASRRALEIDPLMAEAHASLGLLQGALYEGPQSIESLSQAVQLRPSYADAYSWRAFFYVSMGEADNAAASARRAVVLDPLSGEALSNLTLASVANGQFSEALEFAAATEEALPDWSTVPFYQSLAYYHLQEYDLACQALKDITVEWTGHGAETTKAMCMIQLGDNAGASEILEEMQQLDDFAAVGLIHAALGDIDNAFAAFARNEDWGHWPAMALRVFFPDTLSELRADPRFEPLMLRVDEYWNVRP